ncbi:DUF732 domain-containing protein [Mycobacterium malmoense]|uniref:DUF732 domain-containing protein n=1 Tax=Mycobacterium malmoense TaxID=1780 RepID=UPI0008F852D2|nr:DUF732 domain-containing protein [Mycobacterium malmoense]OIN79790.1 hypothetical protein BMG05_16730 [Mycobacterium malmoense]
MKRAPIFLAVIATFAAAPLARADDTDTTFLDALHNHGISNEKGDQELIGLGHSICNLLADGYSMNSIVDMGDLHERHGMSDDDVRFLVRTSAASYCPEYIE